MKTKQKLILDKYVENKFYISIEKKVIKTLGDVWAYEFEIRCAHTKIFNKLRKVERKEGYLRLNSVTQEEDENVKENYWKYIISGSINGGSPFEHTEMLKDLERVIQ